MRCHFSSLTILSVTKRHFCIRTMACVAFGCNNVAFAAQCSVRMRASLHAYHYWVLCIRDVTYLVRDTSIVEFVLRVFNNYFLHNGVINCIHSKIQISPGMYTTRCVYSVGWGCACQFNMAVGVTNILFALWRSDIGVLLRAGKANRRLISRLHSHSLGILVGYCLQRYFFKHFEVYI